jgi:hypothetical protein
MECFFCPIKALVKVSHFSLDFLRAGSAWGFYKRHGKTPKFLTKFKTPFMNNRKKNQLSVNEQQLIQKVMSKIDKKRDVKWYEFYSSYGQATTWIFNDLTGAIAQGTSASDRIGTTIRLSKINFRAMVAVGDATNVYRIILFRWRVSDTSDAPGAAELFSPTGLGSYPVNAPLLPTKPSRFQIVKDWTFSLATNWQPVQIFNFDLPLNWDVAYDTGVNTGKDHLYMATCSDSGGVPNPSAIFEHMIHFHDSD